MYRGPPKYQNHSCKQKKQNLVVEPQYPSSIISDEEAMRIHGLIDDDSDSDSGKSTLDDLYYSCKPPPLEINRNKIVTIRAIDNKNKDFSNQASTKNVPRPLKNKKAPKKARNRPSKRQRNTNSRNQLVLSGTPQNIKATCKRESPNQLNWTDFQRQSDAGTSEPNLTDRQNVSPTNPKVDISPTKRENNVVSSSENNFHDSPTAKLGASSTWQPVTEVRLSENVVANERNTGNVQDDSDRQLSCPGRGPASYDTFSKSSSPVILKVEAPSLAINENTNEGRDDRAVATNEYEGVQARGEIGCDNDSSIDSEVFEEPPATKWWNCCPGLASVLFCRKS